MNYKLFILTAVIGTSILTSSCKDEFADINTNPDSITDANIPYLFTRGVMAFDPSDYTYWFYNTRYTSRWVQSFVAEGGYTDQFNVMGAAGGQGTQSLQLLKYARDIDQAFKDIGADESAKFAHIRAVLNPLIVYLAIFDSDIYGAINFSEACMARYGGTLTPKYDTVDELYPEFLSMLNASLAAFANTSVPQTFPSNQDPVYKGDIAKWAKLTNSLKLRIAVRYLHRDKAQALKIAEEVAASSAGVLDGSADDFIFNKGINDFHFGNSNSVEQIGVGAKPVVDFLVKNKDPRVRFFYGKNRYNSKIVQAFFDAEMSNPTGSAKLPAYILDNVNYTTVDGKKVFQTWKAPGEPWVRYYGLPTDVGAAQQASVWGDYFESLRWKIGPSTGEKTYAPFSRFMEELVRGPIDYTVPTVPGGPVIQNLIDNPWYGMYMTTGEVNLLLAELKLIGANLPKTAAEYFEKAIRSSVTAYDRIAALNKIPYYGTTYGYDENEKVIDLQDGEIEALLTSPAYQLTGTAAEQLEKVYIQQYLHFMFHPNEQYVTVRRSGVPKVGSSLLPWNPIAANTTIPRRFDVNPPTPTDLMFQITTDIYKQEGFTPGSSNNPSLLNSERLWQDVGAPNFGEGPNF